MQMRPTRPIKKATFGFFTLACAAIFFAGGFALASTELDSKSEAAPFGKLADSILINLSSTDQSAQPTCVGALLDATHAVTVVDCVPRDGLTSEKFFAIARKDMVHEHEIKNIYVVKDAGVALIELAAPIESAVLVGVAEKDVTAWLAMSGDGDSVTQYVKITELQTDKNQLHYQLPAGVNAKKGAPILDGKGRLIGIHGGSDASAGFGYEISGLTPFLSNDSKCGNAPGIKCVNWQTFFMPVENSDQNQDKRFTLITTEEFERSLHSQLPAITEKRPPDPDAPRIRVATPTLGGDTTAPVDVLVSFEAMAGAEIVPSTFKARYGMFGIDVTDRLLKHAELGKNSLSAKRADLPKGNHTIELEIQDSKGRVGLLTLNFTVN